MINTQTMDDQTTTQIQVDNDMPMPSVTIKKMKEEDDSQEPLRFAKLIVRCPCLLCVMILLLLCGITYVDSLYFVYTSDASRMYLVEGEIWTERADALVLAQDHVAAASRDNEAAVPQTQPEPFWSYQIMFKLRDESADDHWILTPQNIKSIIAYEDKIYLSDEWQNQFCAVRENETLNHYNFSCASSIQSMARDIAISYNYNYSAMSVADIKSYVLERITNPYYSILFNPDINRTKQSHIYRTLLHAAMPIATGKDVDGAHVSKYVNAEDHYTEQELTYSEWAQGLWNDITVEPNGEYSDGNLEILALSYVVFVEYFISLLSEAMFFVIFAVMAVLFYMTLHLRSIIISVAALIEILMSFPLAFFFYRLLFQVTHFDTFSSLIIFVLLGVGADDVFVMTDAWYQSVNFVDTSKDDALLRRMSFTYARASKAMFITQVTTFFAFMATATSLIMPISAFGIWAATIVACNYILVVTLFPCIIILHEMYLKRYEQMLCCFVCNAIKKRCIEPKSKEDEEDHYRASERFFGGSFTDFILRFRVYILVFFVIVYGTCIYFALQLKANKGDEVWFEDDHFMQKVSDATNAFTAGETDGLFGVNVVWGVKGVDRRGTSKWDSEDYGVIEWDKDFDFSRIEGQEFIRDTCDDSKENHLSFSSETAVCVPDYVSLSDDSVSWQWADFAVKRAFISSAIQGVLIGMPLAFVILLISTRNINWIISVFAVFDMVNGATILSSSTSPQYWYDDYNYTESTDASIDSWVNIGNISQGYPSYGYTSECRPLTMCQYNDGIANISQLWGWYAINNPQPGMKHGFMCDRYSIVDYSLDIYFCIEGKTQGDAFYLDRDNTNHAIINWDDSGFSNATSSQNQPGTHCNPRRIRKFTFTDSFQVEPHDLFVIAIRQKTANGDNNVVGFNNFHIQCVFPPTSPPTAAPTDVTSSPTYVPTVSPTRAPTSNPTEIPTYHPTSAPTRSTASPTSPRITVLRGSTSPDYWYDDYNYTNRSDPTLNSWVNIEGYGSSEATSRCTPTTMCQYNDGVQNVTTLWGWYGNSVLKGMRHGFVCDSQGVIDYTFDIYFCIEGKTQGDRFHIDRTAPIGNKQEVIYWDDNNFSNVSGSQNQPGTHCNPRVIRKFTFTDSFQVEPHDLFVIAIRQKTANGDNNVVGFNNFHIQCVFPPTSPPTAAPTDVTSSPTYVPTVSPTRAPTSNPTEIPTYHPTSAPTRSTASPTSPRITVLRGSTSPDYWYDDYNYTESTDASIDSWVNIGNISQGYPSYGYTSECRPLTMCQYND
eukprot:383151_1